MNLVKFLLIGAIYSTCFGVLLRYPFGGAVTAINIDDIFVFLTAMFFLIWKIAIKKQIKIFPKVFYLMLIYWVTGFVALVLSGNLSGGLYLIRFIFYTLTFVMSYILVVEKVWDFETIAKHVIEVCVVLSVLGVVQLVVFSDLRALTDYGFDPHNGRMVSTFLDPNFLGSFLNIGLLLLVYLYRSYSKKMFWSLFVLILVAIFFTFSRSAYLQLFVGLFLSLIVINKKLLVLLFIVPLVLLMTSPRFADRISGAVFLDLSANERFWSWNKGWEIVKLSPVIGVGFNNIRSFSIEKNLLKTQSVDGGNSGGGVDSSLLFVTATTGVIGLTLYLSFFVVNFYNKMVSVPLGVYKYILPIIFFALCVNSFFINSLFYPPIMVVLYTLMGGWVVERK